MRLLRAKRTILATLAAVILLLSDPGATAQKVPSLNRADPEWTLVTWRGFDVIADRAVVRYVPGTTPQERSALHQQLDARVLRNLGADMAVLELAGGSSLEARLALLEGRAAIRSADPDVAISTVATLSAAPTAAGDPASNLQWSLARVRASEAWATAQGDPDVVVAILDSGVLTSHPDLAAHYAWGMDLFAGDNDPQDTNGHGTHCAGLAAAVTDNGLGIAGIAHSCRYAAYRCGDGLTLSSSLVIAAVLDAADRGAQVLSMSFGMYLDLPSMDHALQTAADAGCVLVAAAGNDGQDVPFFPAAYPQVIGVAASAPNDSRAIFSNFGDWVSLAAPGQSMYSTGLNNGYGYMSGTSMACPLVAGMAALLYAHGGGVQSPALGAAVRTALEDSAVPLAGAWVTAGRVDLAAAVEAMGTGAAPVVTNLSPDHADALGGGSVTVTGSGFLGSTGGLLGSLPVSVSVVDDSTITFDLPAAPSLGELSFIVQKSADASAPVVFQIHAVDPPRQIVGPVVSVGETLDWTFGMSPGEHWILLASLSPTTATIQHWLILSPFVIGAMGLSNDQGQAGFSATIPAGVEGITLYTQMLSGPGHLASVTAVSSTVVLP